MRFRLCAPLCGLLTICGLFLGVSGAYAADLGFDTTTYFPPVDGFGILSQDTTQIHPPLNFGAGLNFHFQNSSLIVQHNDGSKTYKDTLIGPSLKLDLTFAAAFCSYYEFGFDLPAMLYQDAHPLSARQSPKRAVFGDIRLHNKIRALDREKYPVGLAVIATLVTPSGTPDSSFGNHKVGAEFKAVIDRQQGPVLVAGQFGYRVRDAVEVTKLVDLQGVKRFSQHIDDELVYGIAASYATPLKGLDVQAGLRGTTLAEDVRQRFNNPLLIEAGVRYALPQGFSLSGAFEVGLIPGYGAGKGGFTVGLAYAFDKFKAPGKAPKDVDTDRDGIPNGVDQCPFEPEDYDDYQDLDGCPEKDNDQDGVPDESDKCPNAKGQGKPDGCPVLDSDRDGILDEKDACPNEPEDFDGFEDEDGCPDPDNDHDGIPDLIDKCLNEPEDFDGFEDADGCPDLDNDKDGIPDAQDKCLNEAETLDDKSDHPGCVSKGKPLIAYTPNAIEFKKTIEFEKDSPALKRGSLVIMERVVQVLKGHAADFDQLVIEVAADTGKDAKRQKDLAQARANLLRSTIGARGFDTKRIEAKVRANEPAAAKGKGKKKAATVARITFTLTQPKADAAKPPVAEAKGQPEAPKPATTPAAPAKPEVVPDWLKKMSDTPKAEPAPAMPPKPVAPMPKPEPVAPAPAPKAAPATPPAAAPTPAPTAVPVPAPAAAPAPAPAPEEKKKDKPKLLPDWLEGAGTEAQKKP